jgi:gas vesicle protein
MRALSFVTLVGIGAGAIYLLDPKKGEKRRAHLRKQIDRAVDNASDYWDEYSPELKRRAGEFSREFGKRAGSFSRDFSERAGVLTREWGEKAGEASKDYAGKAADYAANGRFRWSPSARMATAVGSALAVYGAGRGGFFGTVLRTLSLGMFLRALLASR